MKLPELYELRECFWKLNRQELVVFQKMIKGDSLKGQPDKLLEGVDEFLNSLLLKAKDPELIEVINQFRQDISTIRCSPFAHL